MSLQNLVLVVSDQLDPQSWSSILGISAFYRDFLMRHEDRFKDHPRAGMQGRNLARLDAERRDAIRSQADALRNRLEPSST